MPHDTLASPGKARAPFLLLRKFLKHGTRVASVAPSSKPMAQAICRHIDPTTPQTIVELGAGTGPVTEIASQLMHRDSRLLAIELDPHFLKVLRRRGTRATVIDGNVGRLNDILNEHDVTNVDLVLSGLPVPSLPKSINRHIFDTLHARTHKQTWFSQLTVIPWVYKRIYQRLFEEVHFELVPANIPPGGAYHCRNLKPDYAQRIPGK